MLVNRSTISSVVGHLKSVLFSLKHLQNHLNSTQNETKSTIKQCLT